MVETAIIVIALIVAGSMGLWVSGHSDAPSLGAWPSSVPLRQAGQMHPTFDFDWQDPLSDTYDPWWSILYAAHRQKPCPVHGVPFRRNEHFIQHSALEIELTDHPEWQHADGVWRDHPPELRIEPGAIIWIPAGKAPKKSRLRKGAVCSTQHE